MVHSLASELSQLGHDVQVVVSEKGDVSDLPGVVVDECRAVRSKHLHTISQILSGGRQVATFGPDIVHIHGLGPAIPLAWTRRPFAHRPTIVTAHGLDWKRDKWSGLAAGAFRAGALRGANRSEHLTAVARTNCAQLSAELRREVEFIPNGVAAFPDSDCHGILRSFDLQHGEYSVAISRFTPEKNLEQIVSAYTPEVATRLGPLLVIGSRTSSYASKYAETVLANAGPHVRFVGEQPHADAMGLLKHAGRFISMSKLEAQPLSVLEAMRLGVPLYLSDIAEHQEVTGGHAQWAAVGDTRGLQELLVNPAAADIERPLAAEAGEEAAKLTWRAAALAYEAAYQRVLTSVAKPMVGARSAESDWRT